jgi:hypothetical protein
VRSSRIERSADIQPHFMATDKAREFLEAERWPEGPEGPVPERVRFSL